MRLRISLRLLLLCVAGLLQPVHASDWADSQEVRNRLDQLRTKPGKPSSAHISDDLPVSFAERVQQSVKPWRNIAYDNIAPMEPSKKNVISQDRKIEVAEADKLGYQINNPSMRDKVLELYRRPDIVVEQYVIGQ